MSAPLFTVFTPTFDRAHTLARVHESLARQTLVDFEWLIIDDGSTDSTAELVQGWQQASTFPIRYLQRSHRGAHVVHNESVLEARGRFWVKLDSDDGCVPNALERLNAAWESIPEDERGSFSGVTGLCRDQEGKRVGSAFPREPLDCTSVELEYRYKVQGEKWGFLRTEVVRQFAFPENIGGNFVPESYIWSQVSRRYQTRHINEELRIYWMNEPSLVHGASNPATNAAGHRARFSFLEGRGVPAQWKAVTSWGGRILWLKGLPVGTLMAWRDRWRWR
jgi:glycosyltransferase involved in cell wall biosynthesis